MKVHCGHWKENHFQVKWSPRPYYLIICKFFNCVLKKSIPFLWKSHPRQELQVLLLFSVLKWRNKCRFAPPLTEVLQHRDSTSGLSCPVSCKVPSHCADPALQTCKITRLERKPGCWLFYFPAVQFHVYVLGILSISSQVLLLSLFIWLGFSVVCKEKQDMTDYAVTEGAHS